MMLPLMNGPELLRALRAHPSMRQVPVIVTTAHAEDAGLLEDDARALGVVEYLRKPVQMEELRALLKRTLANSPRR